MTDEAKALVEQTINVARKIVEEEYLQLMAEMTQRHMEAALKARNEQNSIIEALSAENERLRDALEKIARLRTDLSGDFSLGSKQSDIARAALGETE